METERLLSSHNIRMILGLYLPPSELHAAYIQVHLDEAKIQTMMVDGPS
jgi:hypothetical protein